MGGGSGGRGLGSRSRATTPGLLNLQPPTNPHHIPLLLRDCAHRPPSHPRGGGAPGREGGMVGLVDGSTPQAPAPTPTSRTQPFELPQREILKAD